MFLILCYPYNLKAQEDNKLQLQVSDTVSIYSEKAYRKDAGKVFEAIGNVVIISGTETLYGERASINLETGKVNIEGSVRIVSKDVTIYGSSIFYDTQTQLMSVENVRLQNSDFNIVADKLEKISENVYIANKAEFTTCKDCAESWKVYGDEIKVEMNQYLSIRHALIKVKDIDIIYVPYIAIPIKDKRESGLLFPLLLSRVDEGISFQQPVYWAIDDHKDATITPSFWGRRGYGTDLEYRQVFAENNWLEYNHRFVNDNIYQPGKLDISDSGSSYFRHLFELEHHGQWSNDFTEHIKISGTKDLDIFRDYADYSDDYLQESDIGVEAFVEKRFDTAMIGLETNYKRNLLVSDAEIFDKSYVQVLPSVYFNYMPTTIYSSDKPMLSNISVGMNSEFTRFSQIEKNEDEFLRNANRIELAPYINWHFFNWGPVSMSTNYTLYYQDYNFEDSSESGYYKSAGFMQTEFSFTVDKIFGLAYEDQISPEEFHGRKDDKKLKSNSNMVGELPEFIHTLNEESLIVAKNSYRHSQEFKFIHHYIPHDDEAGNRRFDAQIRNAQGWFDYSDAVLAEQADLGSNSTRTLIPRENTLEVQWNNLLIRKSPKRFNYFEDQRYLRDNFNYSRVGYFNVSQGLIVDEDRDYKERLTRLLIDTGYHAESWHLNYQQFYFHQDNSQITTLNAIKNFESINFLLAFNNNTLAGADLRTIRLGSQFRASDSFGLSYMQERDLEADQNIVSLYNIDIMPDNNCWIFNISYRESLVDQRYAVNFVFNFGNDEFKRYKNDFISTEGLRQLR